MRCYARGSSVRRQIARWQTWWVRLFAAAVLAAVVFELPRRVDLPLIAAPLLLAVVRPPRSTRPRVDLRSPVRGRWVAVNSPGTRVPSHGVRAYGQAYAIDLLHPAEVDASPGLGWSLIGRRPPWCRALRQDRHSGPNAITPSVGTGVDAVIGGAGCRCRARGSRGHACRRIARSVVVSSR